MLQLRFTALTFRKAFEDISSSVIVAAFLVLFHDYAFIKAKLCISTSSMIWLVKPKTHSYLSLAVHRTHQSKSRQSCYASVSSGYTYGRIQTSDSIVSNNRSVVPLRSQNMKFIYITIPTVLNLLLNYIPHNIPHVLISTS